jgi:hypothetical protein
MRPPAAGFPNVKRWSSNCKILSGSNRQAAWIALKHVDLEPIVKKSFPVGFFSCIVFFYTEGYAPMSAEKTVSISIRVSHRFKALLEAAATREHRSQTNMLETLLFTHCEQHRLTEPVEAASTSKQRGAKS